MTSLVIKEKIPSLSVILVKVLRVLRYSHNGNYLNLISEVIAKMKKASSKAEDSFEEGELSNSDDNG